MQTRLKDRIISAVLIVVFFLVIASSAYFIIRIMTRWSVEGLG